MPTSTRKPDLSPITLAIVGTSAALIALTLGLLFWPDVYNAGPDDGAIAPAGRSSGQRAVARFATTSAWFPTETSLAIEGVVVDQDDVPVPGAEVRVTSHAPVRSGPDGRFHIGDIQPGRYDLTAQADAAEVGPLSLEIVDKSISVVVRLRTGAHIVAEIRPGFSGGPDRPRDRRPRRPLRAIVRAGRA